LDKKPFVGQFHNSLRLPKEETTFLTSVSMFL
jgi:hypothetical protein